MNIKAMKVGQQVRLKIDYVPFYGRRCNGRSFVSILAGAIWIVMVVDTPPVFGRLRFCCVDFLRGVCVFDTHGLREFERRMVFDKDHVWRCAVKPRDMELV